MAVTGAVTPTSGGLVFILAENMEPSLENGELGYIEEIGMEEFGARDGLFLIGVSLKGVIVGPFTVTGSYYSETDLGFVHMIPTERPKLVKALCPWRVSFEKEQFATIEYGLPWSYVCEKVGIEPENWDHFRLTALTDEQFGQMLTMFRNLNSHPWSYPERVAIDKLATSRKELSEWRKMWNQDIADQEQIAMEEEDYPGSEGSSLDDYVEHILDK